MPAIITVKQLESLQLDLSDLSNQQRKHQQIVQLIVVPAPGPESTRADRQTTDAQATPVDDLQLATWEDAEWR